jgi:hypothetical protein
MSPDGKTVAVGLFAGPAGIGRIVLIDVKTQAQSDLYVTPASARLGPIAWAPDSQAVFISQQNGDTGPMRLLKVPVAGGSPEDTGLTFERAGDIAISPDGTHAAIGYRTPNVSEILAIGNLESSLASQK